MTTWRKMALLSLFVSLLLSAAASRILKQRTISYGALQRDGIPCDGKDNDQSNCKPQAFSGFPYNRGCNAITRCRSGDVGGAHASQLQLY
ncbi:hypothetical protein ACH5RR_009613 [Cinchona calisaya]|uniref:Rapid ALkalinization Factor n=1 Tax=Cinchona calisaya TaxID=153742 RepID=A0ABD3AH04_9GENT